MDLSDTFWNPLRHVAAWKWIQIKRIVKANWHEEGIQYVKFCFSALFTTMNQHIEIEGLP